MDQHRFDALTRSLATRRLAMRAVGIGGLAALLKPAALTAARQDDSDSCSFTLSTEMVTGPDAGETASAQLVFTVAPDGAIETGQYVDGSRTGEVVGQALGRALTLRITLPNGDGALALHGVAEEPVTECALPLSGHFAGPGSTDLGTWEVRAQSAQPSATSGAGQLAPAATPCPEHDCGGTFVVDPRTCECGCAPPYDRCGDVCCPGGSDCLDPASGICQCPVGTEICAEVCTLSCAGGLVLDFNTCECRCDGGLIECNGTCIDPMTDEDNCGSCGNFCTSTQQCAGGTCTACAANSTNCSTNLECCSGFCSAGSQCLFCNGAICGDGICADLVNDANNCGACGTVCQSGVPCIAGTCTCPPGVVNCGAGCTDVMSDSANCAACGSPCGGTYLITGAGQIVYPISQSCVAGSCCNPDGSDCSNGAPCCAGSTCEPAGTISRCNT